MKYLASRAVRIKATHQLRTTATDQEILARQLAALTPYSVPRRIVGLTVSDLELVKSAARMDWEMLVTRATFALPTQKERGAAQT
jgi:hypothetical protein